MIGCEFIKLVAREQQFSIPKAEDAVLAKETYQNLTTKILPLKDSSYVDIFTNLSNLTWSQVASGGKVALELTAYYYLGKLGGSIASYPLCLF